MQTRVPVVLLLAAGALAGAACSRSRPKPNVVVVVIDTLRADRLPMYGCARNNAPFLGELAQQSLVFENAWTGAPWTVPSTASLMTSTHGFQHGVIDGFEWEKPPEEREKRPVNRIPWELETLPTVARRHGYRTFGISANILVDEELGFERGFDRWRGLDDKDAADVNAVLEEWKDEIAQPEPFFLYLHYFDPHHVYHPRAPWYDPAGLEAPDAASKSAFARFRAKIASGVDLGEDAKEFLPELLGYEKEPMPPELAANPWDTMLAAYDSEIRALDEHLREAFAMLGLPGEAVVIVTVDHGEEFHDHGSFEHGQNLHDELTRAALLLRLPGADAPRGRVPHVASTLDVLPTLRFLWGETPPAQDQGADLVRLARDGAADRHVMSAIEDEPRRDRKPRSQRALIDGRYKAIFRESSEEAQLFDLVADPAELRDLARERPEVVEAFRARLAETLQRAPRWKRTFQMMTPSEAGLEHMNAIGYTGGR